MMVWVSAISACKVPRRPGRMVPTICVRRQTCENPAMYIISWYDIIVTHRSRLFIFHRRRTFCTLYCYTR